MRCSNKYRQIPGGFIQNTRKFCRPDLEDFCKRIGTVFDLLKAKSALYNLGQFVFFSGLSVLELLPLVHLIFATYRNPSSCFRTDTYKNFAAQSQPHGEGFRVK